MMLKLTVAFASLQLIERVVLDHPHHTLSIILALAHANKDDEIVATPSSGRSKRGSVASRLTLPQGGSGSQGDEEVCFLCFELNAIRFIDLNPESKQTIPEPDPVHET